jgi:hypothetical protein
MPQQQKEQRPRRLARQTGLVADRLVRRVAQPTDELCGGQGTVTSRTHWIRTIRQQKRSIGGDRIDQPGCPIQPHSTQQLTQAGPTLLERREGGRVPVQFRQGEHRRIEEQACGVADARASPPVRRDPLLRFRRAPAVRSMRVLGNGLSQHRAMIGER